MWQDQEFQEDMAAARKRAEARLEDRKTARRAEIAARENGVWQGNTLYIYMEPGYVPDVGEGGQGYDDLLGWYGIL